MQKDKNSSDVKIDSSDSSNNEQEMEEDISEIARAIQVSSLAVHHLLENFPDRVPSRLNGKPGQ